MKRLYRRTISLSVFAAFAAGCVSHTQPQLLVREVERAQEALAKALRAQSPERTIGLCSQAIALDSLCAACYYVRSIAWARVQQNEDAAEDLARAMALDSSYGSVTLATIERLAKQKRITRTDTHRPALWNADREKKLLGSDSTGVKNDKSDVRANKSRYALNADTATIVDTSSSGKTISLNRMRTKTDALSATETVRFPIDAANEMNAQGEDGAVDADLRHSATTLTNGLPQSKPAPEMAAENPTGTSREATAPAASEKKDRGAHAPDSLHVCIARVKQNPDDGSAHLCVARQRYARHEFKKAVASAARAIKCDRRLSEAFIVRAKARGARGRYRKALRDINLAIAANTHDSNRYMVKAWIMHCLGRYDKELQSLRLALREGYRYPEYIQKKIQALEAQMEQ